MSARPPRAFRSFDRRDRWLATALGIALALTVAWTLGPGRRSPQAIPAYASADAAELAPLERASLELARAAARSDPAGGSLRVDVRATSDRFDVPLGVSGLAVAVGCAAAPGRPARVLALGTTGADGYASLDVPWIEVERARSAGLALFARVVGSGYQQRSAALPIDAASAPGGAVSATLLAQRGATLRGVLRDAQQRPAAGRVSATRRTTRYQMPASSDALAAPDGSFTLHVGATGTFELTARGERGTTRLPSVEIGRSPSAPLEVTLEGSGVLRGRVVDANGRPLDGLELFVLHAAAERSHETQRQLEREARGNLSQTLLTQPGGAFEAFGLRPGAYVVRASLSPDDLAPIRLTDQPLQTRETAVELTYPLPFLAVRIATPQDPASPTPDPERVASTEGHHPFDSHLEELPAVPLIAVAPVRFDPHIDGPEPHYPAGRRAADGTYRFSAHPRAYRLALIGRGVAFDPVRVDLPPGAGRVDVELPLRPSAPAGTLLVDVTDRDGHPIHRNLAIRIEDPETGQTLIERNRFDRDTQGWPQAFELPAGRYRAVIDGQPNLGFFHSGVITTRVLGRTTQPCEVRSDATVSLDVVLPRGARLELRVRGSANAADRRAGRALLPDRPPYEQLEQARTVRLTLLPLEDPHPQPLPVEFLTPPDPENYRSAYLEPRIALNTRRTSAILPAGRHQLFARTPGGRLATARVTLVDGETTIVELRVP